LSGELSDFVAPASIAAVMAVSISSISAYACAKRHTLKTYVALNLGYWGVATMVAAESHRPHNLDVVGFLDALIFVAPVVWVPGLLLLLCVSGKLASRAIIPLAFAGVLLALPVMRYSGLLASCFIAHDCP
jgi:hypothetical protein